MKCILCKSENISHLETIKRSSLNKVYQKEYSIDISNDIQKDIDYIRCNDCNLKFFTPLQPGGQSFYDKLQMFEWYYKEEKYEYDWVKNLPCIKPSTQLLEVGCGRGTFAEHIACNYKGLEFSTKAVEYAKQKGRLVINKSIEEYAEAFPKQADVVVSFQVVEHTDNPHSFIEACCKALRPGGSLILTTPCEDAWLQHKMDFALNLPPHHVSRWGVKTYESLQCLFPLKLKQTHNEPLDSFHIPWYKDAYTNHILNKKFGIKESVISQPRHLFTKALSKIINNYIFEVPPAFEGIGHTICTEFIKQ